MDLHQLLHAALKHLNTTFHIEKTKILWLTMELFNKTQVFFHRAFFFFCQIWFAYTKVMHDGDITLHQKERADSPEL